MPLKYWSLAFSTACYLINRMPTPMLQLKSPYLILHNQFPNYQKLRSFGCLCYPWLHLYTSHKLQPRSIPCVFVGYSSTQSAYYCLDPTSNKIYTSRHVKFIEHNFPFSNSPSSPLPTPAPDLWSTSSLPLLPTSRQHVPTPTLAQHSPLYSSPSLYHSILLSTPPASISTSPTTSLPSMPSPIPPPPPPPPPRTRPTTRLQNQITKPIRRLNLTATLANPSAEPTTITQAVKNPIWRDAM